MQHIKLNLFFFKTVIMVILTGLMNNDLIIQVMVYNNKNK